MQLSWHAGFRAVVLCMGWSMLLALVAAASARAADLGLVRLQLDDALKPTVVKAIESTVNTARIEDEGDARQLYRRIRPLVRDVLGAQGYFSPEITLERNAEGQVALDNNATPDAQADANHKTRNERPAREERGERGEGQGRRERSPRGEGRRERTPRAEENGTQEVLSLDNATAVEGQAPQTDENGGERRERRSRDRYGRDRRERGDRAPREEGSAEHTSNAPTAEHEQAPQEAHESREPRQPREPRGERSDRAPRHAPREEATPTASAEAAPTRAGMPRVQSFILPVADMQAVAQSSGLEWVNSNPERIAAVQAAIAAEPKPVHIPRERPPVVILDEGPLVLVETRKDL